MEARKAMTANQDTFVYDLLARVAAIQRTIQVTTPVDKVVSVKFALPRWWEPIGNNGFPGFYNRAVRTSSTPNGRPIRKDVYTVMMRLAVGPALAGYKGEYEDWGNMLYTATINRLDREQRLGDPDSGQANTPLQFVEAARIIDADNGIEARRYDENPDSTYMCIDIPLQVTAMFQVFRNS